MPRYALTIEYDGRGFVGWQRQDNGPSVQEAIERAFSAFCGEQTLVYGAGRTDAGVHALAMAAHVDLAAARRAEVIRDAVNHHLRPAPVAILSVAPAEGDFHARFSCVGRAYAYRIVNRRAPLTFEKGLAWRVSGALDADAMHAAAQRLVGRHDFTTFRAASCQSASPVKSVDELSVSRQGDSVIARCAARSFLQHQVRSFVGALVEVGRGKWTGADLQHALEARDRAACAPVAPPDGLYFARADYAKSP